MTGPAPEVPVNGAVWSASGHGWVCVGCAYNQSAPLEISERPAMLIVHGMSWCAIHGLTAMQAFIDTATESPDHAVARIMGLHGRDKRCWE